MYSAGANVTGVIPGFNTTVLKKLPGSMLLIKVENVLMGFAFLAMIIVRLPPYSALCVSSLQIYHLPSCCGIFLHTVPGVVRRCLPADGGDRPPQHRLGKHLPAAL